MITTHGGRRHARPPSGVAAMDERQPPHRGGPPWLSRARSRTAAGLPWVSTAVLLVFVMVGTGFAEEGQGRRPLDPAARLPLFVAVGVLLLRRRRPVVAVATTCTATLVYLTAGYPYGPVLVAVAVGCFSAIVTGHRKAAWWSLNRGRCAPAGSAEPARSHQVTAELSVQSLATARSPRRVTAVSGSRFQRAR
ncbi:hypothetical protein [Streptomyces parvus]|uniref:hypothetical protein n=1 Tax=Streptomyces parvus TaxID=66428 RepID=UPI00382E7157